MAQTVRLSDITVGDGRQVSVVGMQVGESASIRLKSLGIFLGQVIELKRAGDPMVVRAAGSRVAMSRSITDEILVQIDANCEG